MSEPFGEATHRVTRTDAELLQAARQDPGAFPELYDRYAPWMRSWFHRRTGSETVSLDLTAETFAQAWHAAGRFRDEAGGSAGPWLFGIGRNLLRHHYEHDRIESAARLRLVPPVAYAECEEYERVDERDEAGALAPRLRNAVGALPAEQRRALQLRVIHQLPYEEVAGRLGCSRNAARIRVSRALRALTHHVGSAEA